MTQENLNTIVKIIQSGAPALAGELISSLQKLINEYASLKEKVKNYEEKETESKKEAE